MARHIGSLNSKLRKYFDMGLLFTVEQLSELTGESSQYIRVMISRLRKKQYCGKDDPLLLVQNIDDDGVKRWGLRGCKKHANIMKMKRDK